MWRVADEQPNQTGPTLRSTGRSPTPNDEAFVDGTTAIEWEACTNPSSTVDEDCITVQRPDAEIRSR